MLKLEFPNENHRKMYEEMIKEWSKEPDFHQTHPRSLFLGSNYDEFLNIIQVYQQGNIGAVSASLFFLTDHIKIYGGINIRHTLATENIKNYSGHIGYGIRPSERRKGYATKILELGILEARKIGIDKILISCYDGNIGSEKTILKNGGIFEKQVIREGKKLNRYWIQL